MKLRDWYQPWLHVLGWAVFIGLPFWTFPGWVWSEPLLLSFGITQLLTGGVLIGLFYLNLHYLTPQFLRYRRAGVFALRLLLAFTAVVAVLLACLRVFPPVHLTPSFAAADAHSPGPPPGPPPAHDDRPPPAHDDRPPPGSPGGVGPEGPAPARRKPPGLPGLPFWVDWRQLSSAAISYGFVVLVSSLLAVGRRHARSQQAQQDMLYEKTAAELAVLKLQISPHFLFNTLNNIRWLARRKSDATEEAVVTLSQLLRYVLYQAQQDRVPLRREIDHLQHYIDLQKLRLTAKDTVEFTYEGDVDAYLIEPLLFLPFVENAFKYGLHSQQPSRLSIGLRVAARTLVFWCENPIFEPAPAPTPDSGIGIRNVERRLALHYPDGRHSLHLTRTPTQFRVDLTLHLAHDKAALPGAERQAGN